MATLTRFLHDLAAAHLTDGQLLRRFVQQRDEAAFAALVRRHGPLVLGACRRILRDGDAFQLTFLVLARKAGCLRRPEALGPWLYGVASRTARKARAKEARRQHGECQARISPVVQDPDRPEWADVRAVLDTAVAGLPEKYREAFVLHHLQGLAVAEVARRLGCPQGTVAARLARAKVRLRGRLRRQGVTLSAVALIPTLERAAATEVVPAHLVSGTVEAATQVAAGKAAGALSALAAILNRGGLSVMTLNKLGVGLAIAATVGVLGVGLGRWWEPGRGQPGAGRTSGQAPAHERFYAGGFHSLRGFALRNDGPDGTDFKFLNSIEYQIPLRADDPCFIVNFVDSGTVERNVSNRGLRGAGQEFRIEVVPGAPSQRYTATFREPLRSDRLSRLGVNSDAGLVGGIILNERNFDMQDVPHPGQPPAAPGFRIRVPHLGPAPLDFGFPVDREQQGREQEFNFWLGLFA